MHMLEDHAIPWLEEWKCGLGFHEEHGLESIHTQFDSLKLTYRNIRDRANKLQHILQEHHLQISQKQIHTSPRLRKESNKTFLSNFNNIAHYRFCNAIHVPLFLYLFILYYFLLSVSNMDTEIANSYHVTYHRTNRAINQMC